MELNTLCPVCIIEYDGKFGDEPHDYVVDHVKLEHCELHSNNKNDTVFFTAGKKLINAHYECGCKDVN